MASKSKEFLPILQKYQAQGPELEIYKENLEDAIEGTQDALNEAEKAKKKAAPPPVRRKN
jgi:chaperonin cofactor prefoldin